jgi:hypothetical protein
VILILAALVFSNISFGATPVVKADCTPLMIKASLMASGELTPESATAQYLQYLKFFLDEDYLVFSDLKPLLGFKKFPNLITIFGEKIPEGYIYREDIEKLLPLLNQVEVAREIEKLIKENIKEEIKKVKAYNGAENVVAVFPASRKSSKAKPNPSALFISNDLGLLAIDWSENLWHVETEKTFPAPTGPRTPGNTIRTISKKYRGHNYIAEVRAQTLSDPADSVSNSSVIIVRDADTGTEIMNFQMESGRRASDVALFLDHNGLPNVFWHVVEQPNKSIALAYGNGERDINGIPIINRIPISEKPWSKVKIVEQYITLTGRLYVLLERAYMEGTNPWSKSEYTVLDMSDGGKEIFTVSMNNPDFYLRCFHKNADDSFSLLGKNQAKEILAYDIRKTTSEKWKGHLIKFESLGSNASIQDVIQFANGNVSYIFESKYDFNGDSWNELLTFSASGIAINSLNESKDTFDHWYSYPEYSPFVVGHGIKNGRSLFYILNSQTWESHIVDIGKDYDATKWQFDGVRFTPDGRGIAYYRKELNNNDPLAPWYKSIQLYGPFNPKTGEAAPWF